ncbi:MAG TPA: HAD-IA family hydrolase [Rhizomicrobium sp.]|jgi:putative hydrolase of the HAD superfamily|nr:HAD-IA family hydrolase [Rhizomicrobium sp.]
MIEAVIWDFGGVFTSSPFEAFARYETEHAIPVGTIRKINATNPETNAWAKFEQSLVDMDGFDRLFLAEAAVLGHTIPGRDVLPLLSGDFRPEVIEALRRVKAAGLKTGCITNNMPHNTASGPKGEGTTAGRSLYSREIMEQFDVVIESAKIGIRKPNPKIYEMMCEQLGVAPAACVFLDDLGGNLKPARAMGMTTIKVESGAQAIAELETATGLKLS